MTIVDPQQARGVRVVPKAGQTKPPIVSTVSRRVKRKASVGRKRMALRKLSQAKHEKIDSDRNYRGLESS